ncbi:SDR family oxidoreductase [Parafilimonas sp.]|uniref:SDR family oxidoreductase n=1 Tax=Parafilimonas sp. TaxID=1969739 RepID=UPI0039E64F05
MSLYNSPSGAGSMNVIITGASKGLGKAFSEKFAAAGHHLFLCARNEELLAATKQQLLEKYPGCKIDISATDISRKENAIAFGNFCLQFGAPQVLINNAGRFLPGNIYEEEDRTFESMLATNLHSAYHLTRTVLPAMIKAKSGHIFNICSIASLAAYKNGGSYSISKFALLGFSKNLREELKSYNIKVTAVMPGAVYTDSWSGSGLSPERIMQADDVVNMVYAASLLSPQACVEEIIMRPQLGDL